MSGGEIVVKPAPVSKFDAAENAIAGNTVLYGATGGSLFVCGMAGERFAVRNSGALAIVEGIGDHGCEYMTNGTVVVIGRTGKNFGAGMSGGIAYILDEDEQFPNKLNNAMVSLQRLSAVEEIELVQSFIQKHLELTGSERAVRLLKDWGTVQAKFWKVVPNDLAKLPPAADAKTAKV